MRSSMKYKIFVIPVFLFLLNTLTAQVNDTIIIKPDDSVEIITRDLDSLVSNWYVKMAYSNLAW